MNATPKAKLATHTLVEKLALVDAVDAVEATLGCPPGVMPGALHVARDPKWIAQQLHERSQFSP